MSWKHQNIIQIIYQMWLSTSVKESSWILHGIHSWVIYWQQSNVIYPICDCKTTQFKVITSKEWPRPTLTWAFSRRRSVPMGSTPASRPDTASSLQTLRADTVAEWHSSTGCLSYSRWRPSGSTDPMSSASRSRQERGGGTSLDVTSPPNTLRR